MRERIMNVMKKKEDNKGFTLVELIVVIVILAILAAILIPGLLKWIDKAKEEQYVLEARNIYLAAQGEIAQNYAKDSDKDKRPTSFSSTVALNKTSIQTLSDVDPINSITVTYVGDTWTINSFVTEFESGGKTVTATMNPNKTWEISVN